MVLHANVTFGDVEKAANAVGVHIDTKKQKLDLGEAKRARSRGEAIHVALAPLFRQLVAQYACGPVQNSSGAGLADLEHVFTELFARNSNRNAGRQRSSGNAAHRWRSRRAMRPGSCTSRS